jgi:hypothetical protein
VTDCASQKKVWIGQMSKKIKNPQRAMLNMEAEVDAAVAKIMQSFPPRSNKSRLFPSLDGRPAYSLGFNAYVTSTP